MKRKNRTSPSVESLEGRALLSILVAEPQHRAAAVSVQASAIGFTTRVGQYGTAAADPGKNAEVNVILGAVGRTGVGSPVYGTVKVYSGTSLVGTVNVNRMVATGGLDIYGLGTFSYRVPANAARGSSIKLTLKYEGGGLNFASQGSAVINVR
ncbi:MAG TPA: hypothetical protein VF590_24585 [Isosphaeraceae bacterium]|jgi:hypothetical protein